MGALVEPMGLSPVTPGRFEAELDTSWNLRPLPQGGILCALAAQAMAESLGEPEQSLRSLHTTFVAQVAHGKLSIDVEILRRGRSMSHLRSEVANAGADRGHVTTAVFGRPRQGFAFTDLEPPESIPPPDSCASYRDPPPPGVPEMEPMAFWSQRVEGRNVLGRAPWEKFTPGRAEQVTWYRFDDPPALDGGSIDPLALVVIADTMPGAVGQRIGPQERPWFAPSVDLAVHILDRWRSPWVLSHNRARHAGEGYASLDTALWDCGDNGQDDPRLVAYATQVCLFTFAGDATGAAEKEQKESR